MPPAITWDNVQADFDALVEAGVYAPLDGALEPIESLIGSRKYPPEVMKRFIKLVRELNEKFEKEMKTAGSEAGKRQSLRKIVQQAEATFEQANWQVENVTNARNVYTFILGAVKEKVEEPEQETKIPVVLQVMTQKEAKELDSGKIIVAMPETYTEDFKKFKDLLKPGWLKNYGATPEEWKPFEVIDKNIEDLMVEMLVKVRQKEGFPKPLVPYFINVHDLSEDRAVLNYLRLNGCFVINDVISMWHPDVQRHYRATLLDAFPSTIVFRIAPLSQNNQPLNLDQPLISFLEQFEDLEFFKRIDADSDLKCKDMWIGTEFKQFVMNFTPQLIPPYDKVNSPLTESIIGKKPR